MSVLRKFNFAIAIVTSMFFANSGFAQDTAPTSNYNSGFKLGFGANVGLPTDGDDYQYALGADVRLQL